MTLKDHVRTAAGALRGGGGLDGLCLLLDLSEGGGKEERQAIGEKEVNDAANY